MVILFWGLGGSCWGLMISSSTLLNYYIAIMKIAFVVAVRSRLVLCLAARVFENSEEFTYWEALGLLLWFELPFREGSVGGRRWPEKSKLMCECSDGWIWYALRRTCLFVIHRTLSFVPMLSVNEDRHMLKEGLVLTWRGWSWSQGITSEGFFGKELVN